MRVASIATLPPHTNTTHQHYHHNHHNRNYSPPESLSWYSGSVSQSSPCRRAWAAPAPGPAPPRAPAVRRTRNFRGPHSIPGAWYILYGVWCLVYGVLPYDTIPPPSDFSPTSITHLSHLPPKSLPHPSHLTTIPRADVLSLQIFHHYGATSTPWPTSPGPVVHHKYFTYVLVQGITKIRLQFHPALSEPRCCVTMVTFGNGFHPLSFV